MAHATNSLMLEATKRARLAPGVGFVQHVNLAAQDEATLHDVEFVHFDDDGRIDRFKLIWTPLRCFHVARTTSTATLTD